MTIEVLFVFPHHASFIDQDLQVLGDRFTVTPLEYRTPRDRYRLISALRRSRVALAWFVLGYSYAMTRFRFLHNARCILIPGGWDIEALPEFAYGEMQSLKRARRTAHALSTADRVLAVSKFSLKNVKKWAPSARADVLYHGFDANRFKPAGEERRGVLTVSRVSPETWNLKGLSVLKEVARCLTDVLFTVVGDTEGAGSLLSDLPPNVVVTGALSQQELIPHYQRAQVYTQLSAVESFGCSLAEAMLCGCVPVVTDRGALPEVVGPIGQRVPYGAVDATVEAIQAALESRDGGRARARMEEMFSLRRRAEGLSNEVKQLLASS